MRLGLFMMPLHCRGRSYGEMYAQDRAAILLADKLGYDEVWVGEHYSARVEPITSPLQFMSSLIYEAPNITFGTGVLALAHHNAAKTAGNVAMFDHMAQGRLLFGIGPGGLPSDFELFGLDDPPERGQRMLDTLDLIQRIWASDPPYELEGRYQSVRIVESHDSSLDIGVMPKPYQEGGPPIFTSAMNRNSGMARLAGSCGWGLISANFNGDSNTASQWAAYEAGAGQAGLAADRDLWRVSRSIVLAETDAEAKAYLQRPDCAVLEYYNYLRVQFEANGLLDILKETEDMPDSEVTDAYCLDRLVVSGSVETVTRRLLELSNSIGPYGGLMAAFHDWDDEPFWRRSMALLADEVMPRLRAELG